jgi:hypothetical protein
MDAATRAGIGSWYGSNNSVFVVLVATECAWVFNASSAPNFELQRDKELKSLCCMFAPITQEHEH